MIDRRLLGYNEVSDREAGYYYFDIPDLGLRILFRGSHFRKRKVADACKRELLLPELGITGIRIRDATHASNAKRVISSKSPCGVDRYFVLHKLFMSNLYDE